MLSYPVHGWTDFQLPGTSVYSLSYLTDIALEWTAQAIHGLETMQPFCLRGYLEPDELLCVVSHARCYVLVESDEPDDALQNESKVECAAMGMLAFCQELYQDFSAAVDTWATFESGTGNRAEEKKVRLLRRLDRLHTLIMKRSADFQEEKEFL